MSKGSRPRRKVTVSASTILSSTSAVLAYKDERELMADAALIGDESVCFYPTMSDLGENVLKAIRNGTFTKRERPDFVNAESRFLLEAMRVDDHPRPGKRDKTRAKESEVFRELQESGFLDSFPHARVVANVSSGLPTDKDHNYRAYVDHFTRTVMKHAGNNTHYRSEQPEFNLGYLIYDESTAYFESVSSGSALGLSNFGKPHFWFDDEAFISVIVKSEVDFLVWMTPNKYMNIQDLSSVPLPEMTIVDVRLLADRTPRTYDSGRMRSVEN